MSYSSAEGEPTAVVNQGLRVPASRARVKYGMGVVWQIWAFCCSSGWCTFVLFPQLLQQRLRILEVVVSKPSVNQP